MVAMKALYELEQKELYELEQKVESAYNWVNALFFATENGVKQGMGQLGNQEEGFCCLGFGCVLGEIDYQKAEGNSADFSASVGLHNILGIPVNPKGSYSLTEMNDAGESFKHIAKEMLRHPEEYFTGGVKTLLKPRFDNYIEQMKLVGEW
jgi:hypothetical protein